MSTHTVSILFASSIYLSKFNYGQPNEDGASGPLKIGFRCTNLPYFKCVAYDEQKERVDETIFRFNGNLIQGVYGLYGLYNKQHI